MNNMNLTKEEALNQIGKLKAQIENVESKLNKGEILFLELISSNIQINNNESNNNNWDIKTDFKNNTIWFRYHTFWSKFESIFGENYQQIKYFLNAMIKKYFNYDKFVIGNINTYQRITIVNYFQP